ncbi:hypothetical protein [Streptomyces syringium]|uniref:hypothetical protein n=1 Tax=Streptomyces syringium TaxID=76729 RepID=UPI003456C86E
MGGTWFLGRAVAHEALARGWQVTTFNRGRSGPDVPSVEAVHGDRTDVEDLVRLAGSGPWDAVIDTSSSALAPRAMLAGAQACAARRPRSGLGPAGQAAVRGLGGRRAPRLTGPRCRAAGPIQQLEC